MESLKLQSVNTIFHLQQQLMFALLILIYFSYDFQLFTIVRNTKQAQESVEFGESQQVW